MPSEAAPEYRQGLVCIVRHGQTSLNRHGVLQGRSDAPLNSAGIVQAQEAAARLLDHQIHFAHVFTSPLRRARQTARILAPYVPAQADERLIEMDYGPYEGQDLSSPSPELAAFFRDFVHTPAPDGMEPLESVVRRAGDFLESVVRPLSASVLISTHAIAMKGLLEYLTPASHGRWWGTHIGNCEIYVFRNDRGQFSLPQRLEDLQ